MNVHLTDYGRWFMGLWKQTADGLGLNDEQACLLLSYGMKVQHLSSMRSVLTKCEAQCGETATTFDGEFCLCEGCAARFAAERS